MEILVAALIFWTGYSIGKKYGTRKIADEAIADLTELREEFDRLSREAKDLQARAEEHGA